MTRAFLPALFPMSQEKDSDKVLKYRKAIPDDCRMVYDWICDPLTRANSYGPPPESYAAHEAWFMNRISEDSGLYLVFYAENADQDPIGQVRVDVKKEGLVVGILTAPAHRGNGYASEMLRILAGLYHQGQFGNQPLRAWIMDRNMPSRKAFEAAGFRFHSSSVTDGIPSGLYLLKEEK
jgi:RimJ/RimL family protein N-acetyltransferase